MVATEMPTPVCIEFGRAFEAQELGLPFEKAVGDMTRRAPDNQDLKIFALSVIVQKETGGNLVEIIEKIAETVRSRYKFQGKLRGAHRRRPNVQLRRRRASRSSRCCSCSTANRPYIMRLFTSEIGHYCLGYAAFSWTVGFFFMRKMTKIKI